MNLLLPLLLPAGDYRVLPQRASRGVGIRWKGARVSCSGLAEPGGNCAGHVPGAFFTALLSTRRCPDSKDRQSLTELINVVYVR